MSAYYLICRFSVRPDVSLGELSPYSFELGHPNVKVVFDPAPPANLDIKPILAILKQGIASLTPGRTMQWALGAPHNRIDWNPHKAYRVRIDAEGPFGAIEPVEYVISVDDLDGSRAAPPGNLHAVAAELHELTKATKELNEIIRSASLEPA